MGERLMTELFFKHKPNDMGELEDKDIARFNRILANLYDEVAEEHDAELPPPEPLPRGAPLRFTAFRAHVYRALSGVAADAGSKERYLERLIDEVSKPDVAVGRGAEVAFVQAPPEPEKIQKEVPCSLPALFGQHGLEDLAGALGDGPAAAAARSALTSSRSFGAKAMELAKEYGETVSAIVRSTSVQERRLAGQAALHAALARIAPQQAMRCAPRTQDDDTFFEEQIEYDDGILDQPIFEDDYDDGLLGSEVAQEMCFDVSYAHQVSFASRPPDYAVDEVETVWTFDAGDGMHIDVRSHPDIGAPRTGAKVQPGERFAVSCELRGSDDVLYLQLADGRGWLFDHKPGHGLMCSRA